MTSVKLHTININHFSPFAQFILKSFIKAFYRFKINLRQNHLLIKNLFTDLCNHFNIKKEWDMDLKTILNLIHSINDDILKDNYLRKYQEYNDI